ncbi:hypothetical protein [Erwinia mallotivora]|nr:hypothetical protein [Erwinia mallotivora]
MREKLALPVIKLGMDQLTAFLPVGQKRKESPDDSAGVRKA